MESRTAVPPLPDSRRRQPRPAVAGPGLPVCFGALGDAVAGPHVSGPLPRAGAGVLSPLHSPGGRPEVVAPTLAFPLGDLLLLGIVVGLLAITGWRPGRAWSLIAAGFLLNAVADGVYLSQDSLGAYQPGTLLDSPWLASV